MSFRPRMCPWVNTHSHKKNRKLQVDGTLPIVFGYCPLVEHCASCAGTGFKPKTEIKFSRSYIFVPCPYCLPEEYVKEVNRIKLEYPHIN